MHTPPPPWGPGGGEVGDRLGWGHIRILYKAPEDFTKPRQTIQSPKATKLQKDYTKLQKNIQSPKKLYKAFKNYTKPR